ncbi:hypothetical protein K3495_g15154, partial [Podosphaera aphanis]
MALSSFRCVLTDDDSCINWYGQLKEIASSLRLKTVLDPQDLTSVPLEYPDVPEYPPPIAQLSYLTIVPNPASSDTTNETTPIYELTNQNVKMSHSLRNTPSVIIRVIASGCIHKNDFKKKKELTTYNRHRLNDDKAKDAIAREIIREQRAHCSQLRMFVFDTIDKSNRAHLQTCINNINSASIGKLVELLRKHRQHSRTSQRAALNTRLSHLKSLAFPE